MMQRLADELKAFWNVNERNYEDIDAALVANHKSAHVFGG
jgi:hypothetical protein